MEHNINIFRGIKYFLDSNLLPRVMHGSRIACDNKAQLMAFQFVPEKEIVKYLTTSSTWRCFDYYHAKSYKTHSLTHWGRVTYICDICVSRLIDIGSDNGLSPDRRQAIIWTNAGILWNGHLGANFSEILIEIYTFSFKKMRFKISSGTWRSFCIGLNVLKTVSFNVFLSK